MIADEAHHLGEELAWGEGFATAASIEPPSQPREPPAFERRARLRDERHRLVSELRRRDGTSHREINAWLNRKLGITSVEQATLADLGARWSCWSASSAGGTGWTSRQAPDMLLAV